MEDNQHHSINEILEQAFKLALAREHEYVTLEHLTLVLLENEEIQEYCNLMTAIPDAIIDDLTEFLNSQNYLVVTGLTRPRKTQTLERAFNRAFTQAIFNGRAGIAPQDMLLSILSERNSHACYYLAQHNVTKEAFLEILGKNSKAETKTKNSS